MRAFCPPKNTPEKDIVMTPEYLAKDIIEHFNPTGKILDPSRGTGAFYDNFKTDNKDWCELGEDRDFLDYDENNIIFTSWVQNEIGDTIFSSIDIHSIIDNTLKINESVEWNYSCFIPDHISGLIKVSSRMRIRPVKPQLFYSDIEFNEYLYLLDNIPIFDINLSLTSHVEPNLPIGVLK